MQDHARMRHSGSTNFLDPSGVHTARVETAIPLSGGKSALESSNRVAVGYECVWAVVGHAGSC